jgi:hypothetical protein
MPHYLTNQYMCYCLLVGEERYIAQRANFERTRQQYRSVVKFGADHLMPELYEVPYEEFLSRIELLKTIFSIEVTHPDRWYKFPLIIIWERLERARKHGRRDVS